MSSDTARPVEILFSYTHTDKKLLEDLETQLYALKRNKRIKCWYDGQIEAGDEWELNISDHLNTADIILLLISPDFLRSDYCNEVEVKRALERHKEGKATVIPVILRKCDWTELEEIGKLQAVPDQAKPVTLWSDRDEAFYDAAKRIKKVVERIEAKLKSVTP